MTSIWHVGRYCDHCGTLRFGPLNKAVATRAEASILVTQLLLRMGASPSEDSVTVAELLRAQLDHGNYSPTSFEDIQRIIDWLPERFTNRTGRDVTPFVLDGLYQQLARDDGDEPPAVEQMHASAVDPIPLRDVDAGRCGDADLASRHRSHGCCGRRS